MKNLENYQAEFTVEQAKQYMENPEVGQQTFIEEVPPVELGRIAAQSAKQVILQKVREAERDKQYRRIQRQALAQSSTRWCEARRVWQCHR